MIATLKKTNKKQTTASSLVRYAVKGIEEKKGNEIVCINLKKIPNNACDYFLICEGNSRTQVQAIAGSVEEFVEKNTGTRPWHVEGMENGEWVLLDYVDVAVHVFQPEARSHYNLENMWADAEIKKINGDASTSLRVTKAKVKKKTSKKKVKAKTKTIKKKVKRKK
ncbi:MAG: ribosome silencing factor [Bacteroidetes bacterium]|nr:ribosome silencing factor [Bacteroidota bacterium]